MRSCGNCGGEGAMRRSAALPDPQEANKEPPAVLAFLPKRRRIWVKILRRCASEAVLLRTDEGDPPFPVFYAPSPFFTRSESIFLGSVISGVGGGEWVRFVYRAEVYCQSHIKF